MLEGIVTGGQYGSKKGCQPYLIPKCNHHEPGPYENCTEEQHTPKCSFTCEAGYPKSYLEDLHYGASAYLVHGVEQIMTEIMTNGPVEAAFTVYADFPTYRSGLLIKRYSYIAIYVKLFQWFNSCSNSYMYDYN